MSKNNLRKKLRRKVKDGILPKIESLQADVLQLAEIYSDGSESSQQISSELIGISVMLSMVDKQVKQTLTRL